MLNTNVKQDSNSYFNPQTFFVWFMLLDYYSLSPFPPQHISSLLQSERLDLFSSM